MAKLIKNIRGMFVAQPRKCNHVAIRSEKAGMNVYVEAIDMKTNQVIASDGYIYGEENDKKSIKRVKKAVLDLDNNYCVISIDHIS